MNITCFFAGALFNCLDVTLKLHTDASGAMARAEAAPPKNIIDLTGDDDDDDQLDTLHDAASKAEAAATRLSNRFKALAAAAHRNTFALKKVVEKETKIEDDAGSVSESVTEDDEVVKPTRPQLPVPKSKIQTPSEGPRLGSFKPHIPFHNKRDVGHTSISDSGKPVSSKDDQNITMSSGRIPRAAAHAAGRIIANTYDIHNPLEEQQDANSKTPKKSGRSKVDQWKPTHSQPKTQHHDKESDMKTSVPVSSNPGAKTSNENRDFSNLLAPARSDSLSEHKRRRQDSFPEISSSSRQTGHAVAQIKSLRKPENEQNGPLQESPSLLPDRAVRSQKKARERNSRGQYGPSRGSSIERTDTISKEPALQIAETTLPPKRSLEPADFAALSKIFNGVVYPVLKKVKARYKDQLEEDDLLSISQTVAQEIVDEKLKEFSLADLLQPTHQQKEEIKRFAKKSFSRKVLSFPKTRAKDSSFPREQMQRQENRHKSSAKEVSRENKLPSSSSPLTYTPPTSIPPSSSVRAASSRARTGKITDLSEYLKKLEGETSPGELSVFDDPSPERPSASVEEDQVVRADPHLSGSVVQTPVADRVAYELPKDGISPPIASAVVEGQVNLNPSTDSTFPPGYDRGRYPYLRRRRGNKFYTPLRPSNSTPQKQVRPVSTRADQRLVENSIFTDGTSPSSSGIKHERSDVAISQTLVHRVTTDLRIKTLCRAVASGEASWAQLRQFQELMEESGQFTRGQTTDHEAGFDGSQSGDSPDLLLDADNALLSEMDDEISDTEVANLLRGFERREMDDERVKNPLAPRYQVTQPLKRNRHHFTSQMSNPDLSLKQNHPETSLRQSSSSMTRSPSPDQVPQIPVSRPLATALDPRLEHTVAVLMTDDHKDLLPENKTPRYVITRAEREELLRQSSLFKYADRKPEQEDKDHGSNNKPRKLTMIEARVVDPSWRPMRQIPSLLRHRAAGSDSHGRNVNTQSELRVRIAEQLESSRYWKGASGDIVAAAWGPDSTTYAVGAAAHTNAEDVQYNRPCNLLLGDLNENTLYELPDHRVDRPKPETLPGTYNARQAVYDACDPMVYETVSSIGFSCSPNRMYTASHDRTVKLWDTSATERKCLQTFVHDAKVTSVEVSSRVPGLFATGSDVIDDSVRVYHTEGSDESHYSTIHYSSSRAQVKPHWKIYPECLRWGPTSETKHLLLAGFRRTEHRDDENPREGHLCLWDVNASTSDSIKVAPSAQGIFAAAWHPTLPFFATGGSPGSVLTDRRRTRTVVRTWDLRIPKHVSMEYECSALDMQDITFSPLDSNIVTAGCTDGTSFVWDYRSPNAPLHRLRHWEPLSDWDQTRGRREEVDTGVMMSLWGLGGSLFYTGSSDGVIKAWDVRRHPQDVLIRNVARFGAGIQSGAFSPDGCSLLVGDADGGVHILESAPSGERPEHKPSDVLSPELPISLVRAPNGSGVTLNPDDGPGTAGQEAAQYLTESKQLQYDTELGVTQGSMYRGPFANHLREEAQDATVRVLSTKKSAADKQSFLRNDQENGEVEESRRTIIRARKRRIHEIYHPLAAAQELKKKIRSIDNDCTSSGPDQSQYEPFNPSTSTDAVTQSLRSRITVDPLGAAHGEHAEAVERNESNVIPESEMIEENHWWPDLGSVEIERARTGKGKLNFPDLE